jgi:hypothetical protein
MSDSIRFKPEVQPFYDKWCEKTKQEDGEATKHKFLYLFEWPSLLVDDWISDNERWYRKLKHDATLMEYLYAQCEGSSKDRENLINFHADCYQELNDMLYCPESHHFQLAVYGALCDAPLYRIDSEKIFQMKDPFLAIRNLKNIEKRIASVESDPVLALISLETPVITTNSLKKQRIC